MMEGVIFDIKRFAVHDGPGIRTTVFLKGCPLRCAWCHNPESQGVGVETLEGRDGPIRVGRSVTVDEVVEDVARDTAFFDESGGGVTFSGGEPLSQPGFLVELLDRCGELEIHRGVDTSGYGPLETLLKVAERTDLFLYDLKPADHTSHLEQTGVELALIQDNLRSLCETGVAIQLRIAVIPGITDTPENLQALGEFVASLPRQLPMKLLPYHRAAMDKYPRVGMAPPLPDTPEPTQTQIEECQRRIGEPR